MVDLRSYPLPRSVAARLEIGHPADTGRTGNDPARSARGAARISENRPCAGPHGPDADRDYCRVLAPVTGGSAQTPLNSSLSYWTKAQRNLNRGGIPQFPRLNAACYLLKPTEDESSTGSVDCTADRHGSI